MKTNTILSSGLMLLSLAGAACSSGDEKPAGPPAAPAVGALIDRMGRPAVNTALTDPFNTTNAAVEDMNKDGYNVAAQSTWADAYKAPFGVSLAIYDSLDRNCGNQVAAGMMAAAGRYDTLAGLLA